MLPIASHSFNVNENANTMSFTSHLYASQNKFCVCCVQIYASWRWKCILGPFSYGLNLAISFNHFRKKLKYWNQNALAFSLTSMYYSVVMSNATVLNFWAQLWLWWLLWLWNTCRGCPWLVLDIYFSAEFSPSLILSLLGFMAETQKGGNSPGTKLTLGHTKDLNLQIFTLASVLLI